MIRLLPGPISVLALLVISASGCKSTRAPRPVGEIDYVGSSTVAMFLRDAEPIYGAARFRIETEPESEGGERAILEGRADFAGIANIPQPETLRMGVATTLVGRDAIAVIVNSRNPVVDLSTPALRQVFTGAVRNWREVGGPDLEVKPFIVGKGSATREVFRRAVLDGEDYAGCLEIQPDAAIVEAVAAEPGGVGQISFAFLEGAAGVRAIAVDGEEPSVTNFGYPISRPLYFLWREGDPVLDAFVDWVQSEEGQRAVMRRFIGRRVLGSARGQPAPAGKGTLVVYTETYAYYDGGTYYYPHKPYEICSREGVPIRRVPNHRGENDESPTRIDLPPGTYLIRTRTSGGEQAEFLVTIEMGRRTELDVSALLQGK